MKREEQMGVQSADRRPLSATEDWSESDAASPVLSVVVPYTTPELTRAALQYVAGSSDLHAYVQLIDVQVVPFPCSMDDPPVSPEYAGLRAQGLLEESGLPGKGHVLFSRDLGEGLRRSVEPHSLVVIAVRKRWWPTAEKKLARLLSRTGHRVVVIEES